MAQRVRRVVDRRFDRAAFDAERTVERFGHRLRDEVDLDTVTDELVGTMSATLHPSSAAVWLRDPTQPA